MANIILSNYINISVNIISKLKQQVKCINCKLNRNDIDKLNCSRTARYQDNNKKISCKMYLYKGK